MFTARFLLALLIVAGAALAACSGNFGAGTSAPGGLLPSGPLGGIAPSPTPTPNSANDIVTYGDSSAFQPLPQAAGYGGAIAFEVPSPRPSGFQSIPVGVTLSIVSPTDAPDLNLATPGKKGTKRARPARPLAFISLLATHDITLSTYPRIAVDVPRDIVTTYREEEINVALYNAGANDKTFRLAVSEHDSASPPPLPTPAHTAPPPPTPIPVTAGSPGASPAVALTPPPASPVPSASPSPVGSPTLPPQRILFAATPATLKLSANKPVVFAVYALPIATPSPGPSGSAAASATGSAAPAASGSPAATGSGAPAGTASASPEASAAATAAGAAVTPSASPSPAKT